MMIHPRSLGLSPAPNYITSDEWVIETQGLGKKYGKVSALRSLDMRIPHHAICGFLGPNGSGKSTTIRLLLGLARPSYGTGTIFGHDIARNSIAIRRRVGYLAQDPRFYDGMTARETLQFTAHFFYTGPPGAINMRVNETLELVGLQDKADRPTGCFSGGEKQRLGIAQAYINNPNLLILDEPAASLDPIGRRDVLDIMRRLRGRTTIFYSTHLLDDVQRVSDMVVIMKDGVAAMQSDVSKLLDSGKVVYEVSARGNWHRAYERLHMQPWIEDVKMVDPDIDPAADQAKWVDPHEPFVWEVTVADAAMAETLLVPLLTEGADVSISEFRRKKLRLEEVFLSIMGDGRGGVTDEIAQDRVGKDQATSSRGATDHEES